MFGSLKKITKKEGGSLQKIFRFPLGIIKIDNLYLIGNK